MALKGDALAAAEEYVLGACLRDGLAVANAAAVLGPEDFLADARRLAFAAVLELFGAGRPVTAESVADALYRRGQAGNVGYAYLAELLERVPVAGSEGHYAALVREASVCRRLLLAAEETAREAADPPGPAEDLLARAEARVFAVAHASVAAGPAPAAEVVDACFDRADARRRAGGAAAGLPTGFADLDRLTAGLHDEELTVLGARPGAGKSAFAVCVAHRVAVEAGQPALVVSLEMGRGELGDRLLCVGSGVDNQRLRKGLLGDRELDALHAAGARVRAAPLWVDDAPYQTVLRVAATARRLKARHGLRLVVLDYLQLVEPEDRRARRHEQIGAVSRRLKLLAKELRCPVLALAQLNRASEDRPDARPRLSDFREGGGQEQDADVALLLHRPEPPGGAPPGPVARVDVIVAKQRNGPTGEVPLYYRRACFRFEDFAPEPPPFARGTRGAV